MYLEQQFPKVEPRHVLPVPHFPSVLIAKLVEGVTEEEVVVDGGTDELLGFGVLVALVEGLTVEDPPLQRVRCVIPFIIPE